MELAGAETMLMNLYRNIDRSKVQFDFLVNADHPCAYDAEIEELGGQIFRIPYYRVTNLVSYRSACRKALSSLSGTHQIVHGHIGAPAAIYLSEAKRQGCYTIAHSHNTKGPLSVPELAFRFSSFPTKYVADYFFACSTQAGIDRYGKRIVTSDRFKVIPNGINAASFMFSEKKREAIRAELGITGKTVVGHVGRFEEQKNHSFLLDTFSAFHRKRPDSKLVLVGSGALQDQVRRQAQELGIASDTLFLGTRTDMDALYSAFDAFVFPSFMEGLSVALLEAQASGLPCIVSEANQNEGIVSKSVRRLSLSEGVETWADQIQEALNEPVVRSNGIYDIRSCGFDVHDSAKKLEQFYLDHAQRD